MASPAILPKLEEYLTATPEVAAPVRQAFEIQFTYPPKAQNES